MTHRNTSLLGTFLDSGAPAGSTDYTTLVVIHGLGFHGGNFRKLIPLASQFNARVVVMNRRDYPGSVPFTPKERAEIARLADAPAGTPGAAEATETFMKERGRELYDYLVDLVKCGGVLPAQDQDKKKGGIVLAGWSLGTLWISALLAHVSSFPVTEVDLTKYVRRIVYYDVPYLCLGYPMPDGLYVPLHDAELAPEEWLEHFCKWISAYYSHGDVARDGVSALESRHYLENPSPTTSRMTTEEVAQCKYDAPGNPGGSDNGVVVACITRHGTCASLRKGAFRLRETVSGMDDWRDVEVRYLWCDASTWEMPLGAWTLRKELEEAEKAGEIVRKVEYVRFRGANHFAHWDQPELTLRGLVGNDVELPWL
ncbi:hypothetical protein L226DRAFT_513358 [Lentinus tigrinus ALCF2SS1-7]|uniref:AB hydrolase-1 domain-containing protein n=1 Tax=Lentinus tigrinus ALCF2SS1-6 TaxID=1328759 RepID=A0A5C2RWR1_9APHY|nr:hypothetical protein L227DRAFT_555021 [Lentinus tigrinus ALCF2SS1-6]RPD71296.1 hypothetical protein L226DRAFT_513358 [Lentinus tigrinus ALCF2SS1-7]